MGASHRPQNTHLASRPALVLDPSPTPRENRSGEAWRHAARRRGLRRPGARVPLERAGPLQHRGGLLRPLGGGDAGRPGADPVDRRGVEAVSFAQLRGRADRLANALSGLGVRPGERVGILLPQCLEAAEAHLAVYKLGAVAIPLFTLFGADALAYRLADSGAVALIGTAEGLATATPSATRYPSCVTALPSRSRRPRARPWRAPDGTVTRTCWPRRAIASRPPTRPPTIRRW